MCNLPDEVFAVAAEGGLLEEPGDEAVVVDLRDVLLLERAHPLAGLARLVLALAAVATTIVHRLPRHRRSGQGHVADTRSRSTASLEENLRRSQGGLVFHFHSLRLGSNSIFSLAEHVPIECLTATRIYPESSHTFESYDASSLCRNVPLALFTVISGFVSPPTTPSPAAVPVLLTERGRRTIGVT